MTDPAAIPPPPNRLRLSPAALALYQRIDRGEDIDTVADAVPLAELVEMGVALPHPRMPERPTLLSLHQAERQMRAKAEQRLRAAVDHMAEIPGFLAELEVQAHRSNSSVTWLDGVARVNEVINSLGFQCEEVLAAQPNVQRKTHEVLIADSDIALLKRGGVMKTLYPASARHEARQQDWVESMVPLGAQVRTLSSPYLRYIVADRRDVIVPDHAGGRESSVGAYHINDRVTGAFVADWFALDWARAQPWLASGETPCSAAQTTQTQRAILRLLCEGLDQDAIGRRLGYSKRTVGKELGKLRAKLGFATLYQVIAWWVQSDEQSFD
ncbi:LuxR C-terminal-related transcriptional regulator [Streptomyces sp. NPDC054863]